MINESIVFFGTGKFATTILEKLLNSNIVDIQKIVTMPDRPAGRKQELQASPIKILAQKYNLNIELLKTSSDGNLYILKSTPPLAKSGATEKIIKQLGKDEDDFNSVLKRLQESIAQKESLLKEKEAIAKDFYIRFKDLFAKQAKINGEIQKNELATDKLTEESRQVEIKVNFNSLKKAEFAASLAALSQDFAQYEGVKLDLEKGEE